MCTNDQGIPTPNDRHAITDRNTNLGDAMNGVYNAKDVTCCKLITNADGSTYWRILLRDGTELALNN